MQSPPRNHCVLTTPCESCNDDGPLDPSCDAHNKHELWSCAPINATATAGTTTPISPTTSDDNELIWTPCTSTHTDRVVHYVLFQCLCLFLGLFSLVLVRRESRKHLTEFDRRRKEGIQMTPLKARGSGSSGTASKNKNSKDEEMISFLGSGDRGGLV